jgi:uncharacterized protein (TIGR02996 family)
VKDLLAAIYADPSDDDARAVYADWLTGRGDPRGELITLQLKKAAGKATDEELARERRVLTKKNARAWAGELGKASYFNPSTERGEFPDGVRIAFERGFLVSAELNVDAAHLRRYTGDETFSTVEDLRLADWRKLDLALVAAFINHPVFSALRRLVVGARHLPALAKGPRAAKLEDIRVIPQPDLDPRSLTPIVRSFPRLKAKKIEAAGY